MNSDNLYFKKAYEVLYQIYANKTYSSIELNQALEEISDNRIKPIVTRIVYGVLEENVKLDYILDSLIDRKPVLSTSIILKIGAYSIIKLDGAPSYAIVNELVGLTKATKTPHNSGLVNKVLKNIDQGKYKVDFENDEMKKLSYEFSCPLWIIKKVYNDYGIEFLKNFLNNKKSSLTHIRININSITRDDFIKELKANKIKYNIGVFENSLFVDYSKIKSTTKLHGKFAVQSIGSMSVVHNMNPQKNDIILDSCAAPGGKSIYIASLIKPNTVYSTDLHKHRVNLIKNYANTQNINNIKLFQGDMTVSNIKLFNKFDKILCDAPCSSIGVLSKKPDVMLFKKEKDIKELAELQLGILNTIKDYLKPGGEILYSTCTLFKQENTDVISKFLDTNKDFEIIDINEPNLDNINEKGAILLTVNELNREYYFIAKLKKL